MQPKKNKIDEQVLYLDRWVDKKSFRTFVYNEEGSKLANSYAEYCELISSGLWYATKECILMKKEEEARQAQEAAKAKENEKVSALVLPMPVEELKENNLSELASKRGRKPKNVNYPIGS